MKLGPVNSEFEREADRISDQVVSGSGVAETVRRSAPAPASVSPGAVTTAAAAVSKGGLPLQSGERAYFEPRFGRDLSHVRIHTDASAASAARGIGARAYTLRNDIAFAPGQFNPDTNDGRHLIAHELTHTLQRAGGQTLRRLCTPTATCSGGPVAGSAEAFNDDQEAQEAAARGRRQGMSPARARSTGHAGRAAQLERFFRARNPSLLGEVHGIFIDADMASGTGAITFSCQGFLGDSLPPGDPDPDGFATATQDCVFVPGAMNREAFRFNRGARRIGGVSRAQWARDTEATLTHEATHAFFEQDIEPMLPRPAGVTTATCSDTNAENELSEVVAMIVEFPIHFDAAQGEASPTGPLHRRLAQYFDFIMDTSGGESIPGALQQLGCICDCNEVDLYIIDRVDTMTAGFTDDQKNALRTEMQRRMPTGSRPSWPDTPKV